MVPWPQPASAATSWLTAQAHTALSAMAVPLVQVQASARSLCTRFGAPTLSETLATLDYCEVISCLMQVCSC
jgi:hypothetical protein